MTSSKPPQGPPMTGESDRVPSAEPSDPSPSRPARALSFLRSIPLLGELPTSAAALLVVGLASISILVSVDLLGLALVVVYRGLGDLLTVLLVALIVAYLLDPLIDRFERKGWNRSVAIVFCLADFVLLAGLIILLLVPYVVTELSTLTTNIDAYLARGGKELKSLEEGLRQITGLDLDLRLGSMTEQIPLLLEKLPQESLNPIKAAVSRAVGSTFGLLGTLVQWALFPIFAFFFLRDFDGMKSGLFSVVPYRFRELVVGQYREIDAKMSQFIRGQCMLCLALAALYGLGLGLFTDIDLAVLIGVLSGLLFVIPYFGTFIGLLLGTALALLKFGLSAQVAYVWAVFGVVQLIEGALLTPKIVGDSVGLHPVVVMLALVAGGNLFGFLGILLAVPLAAIVQVVLGTAIRTYKDTPWFQEGKEGAPSDDALS